MVLKWWFFWIRMAVYIEKVLANMKFLQLFFTEFSNSINFVSICFFSKIFEVFFISNFSSKFWARIREFQIWSKDHFLDLTIQWWELEGLVSPWKFFWTNFCFVGDDLSLCWLIEAHGGCIFMLGGSLCIYALIHVIFICRQKWC